ncbi:MAG: MBL fold metallo-hydrolase [Candidatus Saganbacteria bacterium]|nr:MBL fold metallo-hydrolase [Candidatus Saganbacteria bacterium]
MPEISDNSLDPAKQNSWHGLLKLPSHLRKIWIAKNINEILKTLQKTPFDSRDIHHITHVSSNDYKSPWDIIGFLCLDDNLYEEAEMVFDVIVRKAKEKDMHYGCSVYNRGIAKFLQGRFKEAYEDFKEARHSDLKIKNFNTPTTKAISYMEETIFPTKEIIEDNQKKLIKDLNIPRLVDKIIGPNVLRTLHKWNSSSPLFSRGISQGGGYLLTLKNGRGETKSIAIDPGYDFFDIFRDLGLTIADLDALIITHDHDDHTESVESILSLLAKYNDHNLQKKTKVMDIFGSPGVMLKFQGLLGAKDLFGGKEINFKLMVPRTTIPEINGESLMEKYGFVIHVKQAFHQEMWTGQESSIGLTLETNLKYENGEILKIGVTGDTRYETGIGTQYHDAQLILLNIGSLEKEEGKFLHQHLGMVGCINLLKEARLGKPTLAILTEFGEEFRGKRDVISRIIENWAQPMEPANNSGLIKVLPADIHLITKLPKLEIRETETDVYFPYTEITAEEASPEIIRYKFNG